MLKRSMTLILILGMLVCCSVQAANLVLVTENCDSDGDGIPDDQSFVDWLIAEGHDVDVSRDMWTTLEPDVSADPNDPNGPSKLEILNAADLIIISRATNSGNYDDGDEPTVWNSIETPLIQMSAHLLRSNRWKWLDSTSVSKKDAPLMLVLDTTHPIMSGVPLDENGLGHIVDPNLWTDPNDANDIGQTTFIDVNNIGNGKLIAMTMDGTAPWLVEWDAEVEFYEGSEQIPAAKRLLFMAGSQNRSGITPQGAHNLTAAGEILLRNAIYYMMGVPKIVYVNEFYDVDADGVADDESTVAFLKDSGYYVDVQPDNWRELDETKIQFLNSVDIVIVSRATNSARYNSGDEPTIWNSITTPLIQMNSYLLRSSRWKWIDSTSISKLDAPLMQVINSDHPIMSGLTLDIDNLVQALDPTIAVDPNDPNDIGQTSFVTSADVGNGMLIAQTEDGSCAWIAEWEKDIEFYPGSGQYPAAKRMAFMGGSSNMQGITPQGMHNLTPTGELMLLNTIDYLLTE